MAGNCHAARSQFVGHLEAAPIARREELWLPVAPIAPNRPHGVNDPPGRQGESGSGLGVAGFTSPEGGAGGAKFGDACGAVDRPVDSSPAA